MSSIAPNIPTSSWLVFMEKCANRTEPISCLEAEAIWWKRERRRGRKMPSRWKKPLLWLYWKALWSSLTLSAVSSIFSPCIVPPDCFLLLLLIQILTRWPKRMQKHTLLSRECFQQKSDSTIWPDMTRKKSAKPIILWTFSAKKVKNLSQLLPLGKPHGFSDFLLNKVRASTCFCPSFWAPLGLCLGLFFQQCLDVASIYMEENWSKRGSGTSCSRCDSEENFSCWSFDEWKKCFHSKLFSLIDCNRKSTRHLFEIQTCFSG